MLGLIPVDIGRVILPWPANLGPAGKETTWNHHGHHARNYTSAQMDLSDPRYAQSATTLPNISI